MNARSKSLIVASVIAVLAVGMVVVAIYSNAFNIDNYFASSINNNSGSTAYFTIIISDHAPDEGMNGSAIKGVSAVWPVIHVHIGQKVVINVQMVNADEPHGFAIDNYFPSGVTLRPGESYQVTFVANEAGTFRMYCNVFCAIHPLMQNGQVVVSS
ncbi:MAG: hypothetical protein M1587_09480 [Thaumarchaeota archaeon]|nr:hypothetical protein [Nitrososphaerota archaeon]